MKYIKSINWILTYKCNLKCKHCDIWKNPYKKELSINKIKEILNTNIIKKSYKYYGKEFDIAISGGEPLLIKNLNEIIIEIDKILPGTIHSISTNGMLTNKLIKLLIFLKKRGKKLKKINISIDGDKKTHDYQRGIKGSFFQTIKTIKTIKRLFPNQIIEIKLTITNYNYDKIYFISKLAYKLGIFFSFKPVENMKNYTNQIVKINKNFDEKKIKIIQKQIFNNRYIIYQDKYINKNFFFKIPNFLKNGLGDEKKKCNVANDSITIMPDGKIYSCILMPTIGNIHNKTLDEIWRGSNLENQREIIKNGKCPECMLMCGSFKTKKIYE